MRFCIQCFLILIISSIVIYTYMYVQKHKIAFCVYFNVIFIEKQRKKQVIILASKQSLQGILSLKKVKGFSHALLFSRRMVNLCTHNHVRLAFGSIASGHNSQNHNQNLYHLIDIKSCRWSRAASLNTFVPWTVTIRKLSQIMRLQELF